MRHNTLLFVFIAVCMVTISCTALVEVRSTSIRISRVGQSDLPIWTNPTPTQERKATQSAATPRPLQPARYRSDKGYHANIRKLPGVSADVVTRLASGSCMAVDTWASEKNGRYTWVQVYINGINQGWIAGELLSWYQDAGCTKVLDYDPLGPG